MKTIVSARGRLIKQEAYKLLKGACYAALGAVIGFLLQELQALDLGEYQVFIAAGVSFLTFLLHKVGSKSEYLVK